MSEAQPTVLYLEADDEVTLVVRRLRAADPGPVILVAPGRSRATSSVVAIRLLSRAAEADGRTVSLVGDALTRSLAADAGLAGYATLDEARRADPSSAETAEPKHAAIHVVRGPATDDAAPTLAAVPVVAAAAAVDDITRPVPVVRPAPAPPARPRPTRIGSTRGLWRARPVPAALLAAAALLLAGAVIAGAMLLPAATVTIAPTAETIGPLDYSVLVEDPTRLEGTVTATAEVVATGEYSIQEPARGTVVLFNWTFFPVEVPAGTFVAAGEQAFGVVDTVTVPPGDLTSEGTIQAGEASVGVEAAAPGPAANVAAGEIDTVIDDGTAAQLRGFPSNPQQLVTNPEPTSGGVDTSGPEVMQADVDAAVAALREDVAQAAADAGAAAPDGIVAATEPAEPTIEGIEDLVGTQDQETTEIRGSQAWEVVVADSAEVTALAEQALLDDPDAIPEGMEVLEGTTTVALGEATLDGESMRVEATVSTRAAPVIDPDDVRALVAGLPADEAEAALADVGEATVDLWPGWVTTVPGMDWRVEVRLVDPEAVGQ